LERDAQKKGKEERRTLTGWIPLDDPPSFGF
jgi:hypothetical protein